MILMHKDIPVAKFNTYSDKPCDALEIYNEKELPFGLKGDLEFISKNIMSWHSNRAIPMGRINIDEIKQVLEPFGGLNKVTLNSLGLSLTDTYWYKPEKSDLTWANVSLHQNKFDLDLFNIEFNKFVKPGISPDYRTDGMLNKFWAFDESNNFVLVKEGQPPIVAANEVVASEIAGLLDIPHVEYLKIDFLNDKSYCICKCFAKENEDFVPATDIGNQLEILDGISIYNAVSALNLKSELSDMIAFDVLIHNFDRHFNNFGIILDADTSELKRFVPLFDNGSSFGYTTDSPTDALKFPLNSRSNSVDFITNKIELPNIKMLEGIIDDVYSKYNLSENQKERAKDEIRIGYDLLEERFIELENEIDNFDIGDN